jgi:hypothetical protein
VRACACVWGVCGVVVGSGALVGRVPRCTLTLAA